MLFTEDDDLAAAYELARHGADGHPLGTDELLALIAVRLHCVARSVDYLTHAVSGDDQ